VPAIEPPAGHVEKSLILRPSKTLKRLFWRCSFVAVCLLCLALMAATVRTPAWAPSDYAMSAAAADWLSLPLAALADVKRAIGAWLVRPSEYLAMKRENAELKAMAAEMQAYRHDNIRLKALLEYRSVYPYRYVTGRAVGMLSHGPLERALVLLGKDALPAGGPFAAINERGLIGRTVGHRGMAARVMLLNDVNSRVPVVVGKGFRRAVMAGTNGKYPRLEFLGEDHGVRPGDVVLTSGDGGIFPPDLFVGQAVAGKGEDKSLYVRLYADPSEIRHVSVAVPEDGGAWRDLRREDGEGARTDGGE
jgi:rod shape-determining protein MreC